jgi:hypothetical protein
MEQLMKNLQSAQGSSYIHPQNYNENDEFEVYDDDDDDDDDDDGDE